MLLRFVHVVGLFQFQEHCLIVFGNIMLLLAVWTRLQDLQFLRGLNFTCSLLNIILLFREIKTICFDLIYFTTEV